MKSTEIDRNSLEWRIARKSSGGNCIEVAAAAGGMIAVRHSRRPSGELILYTVAEFDAFVDGIKNGEFDDLVNSTSKGTDSLSQTWAGASAGAGRNPGAGVALGEG
jgi:hypothetical protein